MIRLIVTTSDCGAVASGAPGALPDTYSQSFDVEHPALERALARYPADHYISKMLTYEIRPVKPHEESEAVRRIECAVNRL